MSDSTANLSNLSAALAAAVARNAPSLVTVSARRRFGATGFVWSSQGVIVTASHVVERDEAIEVRLPGGDRQLATLAGRDHGTDLAVLRVATDGLAPAVLAPADLQVGNIVLALGCPAGEAPMASFGIVSAIGGPWRTVRGEEVEGYIRTDATFFPGFSGGPLIDASGRVAGLNSSRLGRGNGLTIPVPTLTRIVADLLERGRVRRAYLGISSQVVRLPEALSAGLEGQQTGLLVTSVEPASPAGSAGLLVGDILVRFAGEPLADTDDLQTLLGAGRIGQPTPVNLIRGGTPAEVTVTVGERS